MDVNRELAEIRRTKGMSLRELAVASGVDHGRISKIENGKIPLSLRDLARLSKALDVASEVCNRWASALLEKYSLAS